MEPTDEQLHQMLWTDKVKAAMSPQRIPARQNNQTAIEHAESIQKHLIHEDSKLSHKLVEKVNAEA